MNEEQQQNYQNLFINMLLTCVSGEEAEILSAAIDVYTKMVQVCINIGQPDQALEYVERSKARNLVELLAHKNIHPKRNLYANQDAYQIHCNQLNQLRREIPET